MQTGSQADRKSGRQEVRQAGRQVGRADRKQNYMAYKRQTDRQARMQAAKPLVSFTI